MREVSFVKRLEFNFSGSVTKRALVIGDADNDEQNELVCANLQGDLAIFKGQNPNKFACAYDLGMVTACVIGDVINSGKNYVTAINMEGWLFIFDVSNGCHSPEADNLASPHLTQASSGASDDTRKSIAEGRTNNEPYKLEILYDQRMPANCKELLIADLDGDGQDEIIIGLTDRVLRTYKWVKIRPDQGKFVGLYKWEFADQIGSVSLNPSRHENCQDILVAQPGGTYARLECFDKSPAINSSSSPATSLVVQSKQQQVTEQPPPPPPVQQLPSTQLQQQSSTESASDGDNVKTEYINKLTPEYHQLALAQMRNHHISTEVLGGIKDGRDSMSYTLIVIATLDGTLMLVNKDEILWSLQVDHQLFALAALESPKDKITTTKALPNLSPNSSTVAQSDEYRATSVQPKELSSDKRQHNNSCQYFVACAWNGKTYIIDEQRNYLRFKFDEAVSAFTAGNYYFDNDHHASIVYATFNNQIVLYYDVVEDNIRPDYLLNEVLNNHENEDLFKQLESLAKKLDIPLLEDANQRSSTSSSSSGLYDNDLESTGNQKHIRFHNLLQDVLYSISDEEIIRK